MADLVNPDVEHDLRPGVVPGFEISGGGVEDVMRRSQSDGSGNGMSGDKTHIKNSSQNIRDVGQVGRELTPEI